MSLLWWCLAVFSLNYRTTNCLGAQLWLHPPPQFLKVLALILTEVQSHPRSFWFLDFSKNLLAQVHCTCGCLCLGFSFSWITLILPFQVSACMSFFLRGHLSSFAPLTPPPPSKFYYPFILVHVALIHYTSQYLLQFQLLFYIYFLISSVK